MPREPILSRFCRSLQLRKNAQFVHASLDFSLFLLPAAISVDLLKLTTAAVRMLTHFWEYLHLDVFGSASAMQREFQWQKIFVEKRKCLITGELSGFNFGNPSCNPIYLRSKSMRSTMIASNLGMHNNSIESRRTTIIG